MTDLIPFDYSGRQVRTVQVDGEPWFVAADVCRAGDRRRRCRMKRRYKVVLTSDDVVSEQTFYLTDAGRDLLLEVAAAFNANARFSVDHRMYVEPSASAAPQGDVA